MVAHSPPRIEVETNVDVEAAHLLLEVFVHNGSGETIREVTIRPEVRQGDFVPEAAAKVIADLANGRSARAAFLLRPGARIPAAVEIAATVGFLDARGSRRRLTAPRVSIDLSLPPLRPTMIAPEAFGDRASRAFLHRFELAIDAPPRDAIGSAEAALAALPLARIEEAVAPADSGARASLFGVDGRGTGYMVRIVAAPRAGGSIIRVTAFAESEPGLFAFHHRVREILGVALGSR